MPDLVEALMWDADETLQHLKAALPNEWTITIRGESRYTVAELHDQNGDRQWVGSNLDPKLLYLDGLGWLVVRNHKPDHPMWRPREREVELRIPNPISTHADPPDLDPAEVAAVYAAKRQP